MSKSKILGITELAENQAQAFSTVNEMLSALENAENKALEINAMTSTYILSNAQVNRNKIIRITGGVAGTLDIPQYTDSPSSASTPTANRLFLVDNQAGFAVVLTTTASSPSEKLTIQPFQKAIVYQVNKKFHPFIAVGGGASGSAVFTVVTFVPGTVPSGELLRFVATEPIVFLDDFNGSLLSVGTNPSTTFAMNVNKNGVVVGTISINTSGIGTFSTVASAVETLNTGDILTITAAVSDPSLTNLSVTLKGTR